MFRGIIIGIALGYFFKPQIEVGVRKIVRVIRNNIKKGKTNYTED